MDDEDPLQSSADFFGAGEQLYRNYHPLLSDHRNVYRTIDNTPLGNVKWQSFSVKYTGTIPDEGTPPWMADSHDVWFRNPHDVIRNMLANPDLAVEMDLQPYCEFATENNERQWQDFMSGDWGWAQADMISKDANTHGSTFVPVILRSNKTTVSVATGQNDYYPLYASISNVQNNVRHAHQNAVVVVAFLAMPKTTKEHADTPGFRNFRHQLFHSSLSFILKNLKLAMTKPEVAHFGDGHYRCVVYRLGPYIADYEEQVLLACILRNWCAKCLSHRGNLDEISLGRSRAHADALIEECDFGTLRFEYSLVGKLVVPQSLHFTSIYKQFPCADIHELLAPDLLHQLIKGAYKDHLVDWVISAVPPFPGLRRFPQGRHFKQWTGDDLKGTYEGYVPTDVVRAFHALLELFTSSATISSLRSPSFEIQDVLTRFHTYCEVFRITGVVSTFSLPRQHSMTHYVYLIRLLGALNGLCSSITESKHIKAVKEPWRHSSRYKALGQMLLTNQCLDKLAASHMDFCICGMLSGRKQAQSVPALASKLHIPHLVNLELTEVPVSIMDCPHFDERIRVFNSAVSTFFVPSDLSGIGGMKREYIHVSPKWRNGHACKDCVFVITDPNAHGMQGMDIAQVLTFFSFRLRGVYYPCAVVHWFNRVGDAPDNDTRMWMVKSSSTGNHVFAVIHVDTIFCSAHLIPV
ncbi:hypothetical protein EV424DRAFT_1474991 [Suillus variegatus]|nr:hypothetical protein EV424DRAFT_1474991 [Suillus variegatus]